MKHFAVLAFALLAACHAHAQDDGADRARIRDERAAAEARLAQEEKSCRAKFAVNDCVDKARRAHTATLSALRRHERVLNDADRKRRAAERQKAMDERNSPERQREAADKRAKALADQQGRDARAAEKAAKRAADDAERARRGPHAKTPSGALVPQGSPREPQAPNGHGPTPEQAAKNRADHELRLKEAQRHKADVAARAAQRTKPLAPDLPPPAR
jgi:phage-related minor tail protein